MSEAHKRMAEARAKLHDALMALADWKRPEAIEILLNAQVEIGEAIRALSRTLSDPDGAELRTLARRI